MTSMTLSAARNSFSSSVRYASALNSSCTLQQQPPKQLRPISICAATCISELDSTFQAPRADWHRRPMMGSSLCHCASRINQQQQPTRGSQWLIANAGDVEVVVAKTIRFEIDARVRNACRCVECWIQASTQCSSLIEIQLIARQLESAK
jgi:hypothetical protein